MYVLDAVVDLCDRAVWSVGLKLIVEIAVSDPAEGMDAGPLCLLCVVQVAPSATSWLPVQGMLNLCLCLCYLETSTVRQPRPELNCCVA